MKLKSIFSVIAFTCLLPAAGFAGADDDDDYARPGWYLGGGGTWAPHWWKAPEDALNTPTSIKTHNTFGFHVRGGYRVNSWFAGELEYEWLDGFDNEMLDFTIFKLRSHAITANAKFLWPGLWRFQPYVLFGAGLAIYEIDDQFGPAAGLENSCTGFAARGAGGLDFYITKNWLLNVEGGGLITTNEVENSAGDNLEELWYVPIQIGVQYRF